MNILLSTLTSHTVNTRYEITDFEKGDVGNVTQISGGMKMAVGDDGSISQAYYPSGAQIRRHANYVMVRSSNSSYWFGDCQGNWHPFD